LTGVPNRFRVTYVQGQDVIPTDVKKLTLMIASQNLMHSAVRKANSDGNNDFQPNLVNVDQELIDKTLQDYTNWTNNNI